MRLVALGIGGQQQISPGHVPLPPIGEPVLEVRQRPRPTHVVLQLVAVMMVRSLRKGVLTAITTPTYLLDPLGIQPHQQGYYKIDDNRVHTSQHDSIMSC